MTGNVRRHAAGPGVRTENEVSALHDERVHAAAFKELFKRYLGRVYRYLRVRVACEEEAVRLTHVVFLRALEALPQYQPLRGSFVAWLVSVARRVVEEPGARRGGVRGVSDALPVLLHPEVRYGRQFATLPQEAIARLGLLISRLSQPERDLLALYFAAELNVLEIAQVLERRPEAVKKQLGSLLLAIKERYYAV
ncbi:RNA polymerase sigma factor [Ktedonosporobacter rubrisoli]|uniref:RNA polymerase sigma factor n=1 Tax=Ktedonosporobacter rubrisoli TaxID=2509675 RepID=UPI0013EEBA42|nr:sigma-70 family RNA polymerase sigma factor [Ktedonosporobacter rubrisoli]